MEKDKYYIPEKEEFHIGFEYEFKPRYRDGLISYINSDFRYVDWWKKQTVGREGDTLLELIESHEDPFNITDVMQYHRDGAVRVKHLDHEDLQSLGWVAGIKKFLHGETDCYRYKNLDYYIYRFQDQMVEIGNGGDMENSETYFEGKIKNISEMRKIMKMIGINE